MAKAFTVFIQKLVNGVTKNIPTSRDRHPFVQVNPDDVGESITDLKRTIKLQQDAVKDATEPYRTNPTLHGELHTNLATTAGQNLVIPHGLGESVKYWYVVDQNSAAFSGKRLADAATVKAYPQDQYLVLAMGSTGTYSIVVCPG